MTADWQSFAAPAVVVLTLAIFGLRAWRNSRRPGGCGGGCARTPRRDRVRPPTRR